MTDLAATLYALLVTGADLAASGAVGEFAKGAGRTAFEALKTRLTSVGAKSVALIEPDPDPDTADLIRKQLAAPAVAADPEIARLADTLRAAILALPAAETARYAVEIDTIRAGRDVLLRAIDGAVKIGSIDAGQDAVIENIRGHPGKP